MSSPEHQRIESLIERMSIEEKVGGCITFEFAGTRLDSHAVDKIRRHHCAGLRLTPHIYTEEPYGTRFDTTGKAFQRVSPYADPVDYAKLLNRLQQLALDSRLGVPLYFSSDQEGDLSQDVARGGVHLFPSQMGLAATGDDELVYQAFRAVARQQRAIGVRMLHTPCLDVNTEPQNPEICTRSFGDDPEAVARFAGLQMKAFRDEGVIATGKHFPGRGNSKVDVHFHADVNRADRDTLWNVDLAPYRALIGAGLPAVMTAHTIYPALDPDELPASVSRRITTDLLRGEMGFTGAITTDAMGMKGVTQRFGCIGEACAAAIAAGADLVLAKVDAARRDEIFDWILKYVRDGRIPIDELNEHNRRVLRLKSDYGLFDAPLVDPHGAALSIRDPQIEQLSRRAAAACSILHRDRDGLLPLSADAPVLVIQQRCDLYHNKAHDVWYHPNMLQEFVRRHAGTVYDLEAELEVTEDDVRAALAMAGKVEVVVVLCMFWRSLPTLVELTGKLIAAGHKVVVVSNTPYPLSCPPAAGTVLLTFSTMPRSLEHAAAVLYGKADCGGTWPLKHFELPG
jgi:beta-N-acetylhexosaminidase